MFKRSFMILMGILIFCGNIDFVNAYDWRYHSNVEFKFYELRDFLNQKVAENEFLKSINFRVVSSDFYGKINSNPRMRSKNNAITYYMRYWVGFNTIFPTYGFLFSVDDKLKIVDKTMPVGGSSIRSDDLFFKIKRYDSGPENNVTRDESELVEKWVLVYKLLIQYVNQFAEEQENIRNR